MWIEASGLMGTVTAEEFATQQGWVFETNASVQTLADGATFDLALSVADIPEDPGDTFALGIAGKFVTTRQAEVEVYLGTQFTGGTSIAVTNRNTISANTSNVSAVTNPTISDLGTLYHLDLIPGTASSGGPPSSIGDSISDSRRVVGTPEAILTRITNTSGESMSVLIQKSWIERKLGETVI
jgi:hypothetical protein